MTTYTWPDSRTFTPQRAELRVIDGTQRTLESPNSGYVQTVSMPGARWGWAFDFGAQTMAERAQVESLLLRLSGREHRLRLWDMKRPRPQGMLTSGVTLASTAAQFATSLQLAGCVGTNRVLGGSFETDSNGDGLADGWTRYSSGSAGTLIQALDSSTFVIVGSYSQWLNASSLGGTSADQQGMFVEIFGVPSLIGQTVSASAQVLGTPGARCSVQLAWADAGGGAVGAINSPAVLLNGASQTVQAVGVCPANAVRAFLYIYQHSGPGGSVGLYVDRVRVEPGSSIGTGGAATLQAGDWLGLATGQLVRVVADATADDLGRMTVEVRHMLRTAAASGSAVTLDKPTALFVRTDAGIALPRQPGGLEPDMSMEFVEVFA